MLTARRYLVSGRVQGVGFRFYVLEAADSEGISGSVKNLPDGRVEVIAEGEREAVDRFEGRIRRGPPAARVEDVERTDEVPSGRVTGFRIA
ncbi:MAG TPA: acylphosphatase [Vicinamibacterales bacterium]|nr:acylphosphatase [Vicinamibacterales bacterium]